MFYSLKMYRNDAQDRTNELSGACHRRCRSWQQAVEHYQNAYNKGQVKAFPEPGSKYWTTPVTPASVIHSHAHLKRCSRPSASSDELYWDRMERDESELGADELIACLSAVNLQDW
jgi:hypothetical protein